MTEYSIRFDKDSGMRTGLREAFPPNLVGRIPATANRPALDYVGHAAVTDRLNTYAPGWTYTVDEVTTIGGACWIRGTMTVGHVSRVEYGDGKDPKEAIGNFIRRGAMRFGVALDLWSKEELLGYPNVEDGEAASGGVTPAASSTQPPTSPWGSDAQPSEAPSQPEGAGEASSSSGGDIDAEPATPDIDNTFATPDQWDELLKRVGGSQTQARTMINKANKTAYTQKTVYQATVAEVAKALAT